MNYKIGDVSRILGISTDLLRYYEKKGVVTPTKDKQNDYRYYDAWDINFLIDCLWYKSFGFGIPQTAYLVTDCGHEDLLSMLDEKQTELEESIRHQELLLERMKQHYHEVLHVKQMLGKCEIAQSPEIVCYLNRFGASYDKNNEKQNLSKEWLQYMPFLQRYFEMHREPGQLRPGSFAWGFSLSMEYTREFSVAVNPPVVHMPAETCIHSAFKSSGKNAFTPRHIDYLYDYAEQNGYTPAGDARGILVCSVLENNSNTGYFEVWLPVTANPA